MAKPRGIFLLMTAKQSAAGGKVKHLRIGITGGIGSGKSTVCKALSIMGYPIYNSDERARQLMQEDPQMVRQIKKLFGAESYDSAGKLDRQLIASSIFQHPELRDALNAIVHPAVRADFVRWTDQQQSSLVFQESALLFETGGYRLFDHTVLVTAPEELRLKRVLERDQSNAEAIRARMKNQLPDEAKIPLAGTVIVNDDRQAVLPQLLLFLDQMNARV